VKARAPVFTLLAAEFLSWTTALVDANVHAMKLAGLVGQILKVAPEQMLSANELYASLDFQGPRNAHLAIPDWHTDEFRGPDMERHEFLTGAEEIAGEVLVFRYVRHHRTMVFHECATLEGAAELVMGETGVFNAFTNLVLVFEHFCLRPFRVTYRDHAGARVFWNGTHKKEDRPFPDRQIEWQKVTA